MAPRTAYTGGMSTTQHPEEGTIMGRTKAVQNPLAEITGGVEFTGTQYAEALKVRTAAMHGHAEGTVDTETKNAARAVVRRARNAIKKAGLTVDQWREAEQVRETALAESKKAARKPRSRKPAASTEVAVPEVTEPPVESEADAA